MSQYTTPFLSPDTPRLLPPRSHTRTSSRSPTRNTLSVHDDIFADLSPARTLEAFTNPSGRLKASIETATPADRAFGTRAAIASKNIQEWLGELEEWAWPVQGGSVGFQVPVAKRRKLSHDEDSYQNGTREFEEPEYIGSLPAWKVGEYEIRIDEIHTEMDSLHVEDIKRQVLDTHFSARSRPSSSASNAPSTLLSSYTRMDDFTALVTAIVLKALPNLSKLMRLLDVWNIRLIVLRKAPSILRQLEDVEVALRSGWNAIQTPSLPHREPNIIDSVSRDGFNIMRNVLQTKVATLGQDLDFVLDTLEGHDDTLPEAWLDRMETLEHDYGEWAVAGDRKVREGEWAQMARMRKEEEEENARRLEIEAAKVAAEKHQAQQLENQRKEEETAIVLAIRELQLLETQKIEMEAARLTEERETEEAGISRLESVNETKNVEASQHNNEEQTVDTKDLGRVTAGVEAEKPETLHEFGESQEVPIKQKALSLDVATEDSSVTLSETEATRVSRKVSEQEEANHNDNQTHSDAREAVFLPTPINDHLAQISKISERANGETEAFKSQGNGTASADFERRQDHTPMHSEPIAAEIPGQMAIVDFHAVEALRTKVQQDTADAEVSRQRAVLQERGSKLTTTAETPKQVGSLDNFEDPEATAETTQERKKQVLNLNTNTADYQLSEQERNNSISLWESGQDDAILESTKSQTSNVGDLEVLLDNDVALRSTQNELNSIASGTNRATDLEEFSRKVESGSLNDVSTSLLQVSDSETYGETSHATSLDKSTFTLAPDTLYTYDGASDNGDKTDGHQSSHGMKTAGHIESGNGLDIVTIGQSKSSPIDKIDGDVRGNEDLQLRPDTPQPKDPVPASEVREVIPTHFVAKTSATMVKSEPPQAETIHHSDSLPSTDVTQKTIQHQMAPIVSSRVPSVAIESVPHWISNVRSGESPASVGIPTERHRKTLSVSSDYSISEPTPEIFEAEPAEYFRPIVSPIKSARSSTAFSEPSTPRSPVTTIDVTSFGDIVPAEISRDTNTSPRQVTRLAETFPCGSEQTAVTEIQHAESLKIDSGDGAVESTPRTPDVELEDQFPVIARKTSMTRMNSGAKQVSVLRRDSQVSNSSFVTTVGLDAEPDFPIRPSTPDSTDVDADFREADDPSPSIRRHRNGKSHDYSSPDSPPPIPGLSNRMPITYSRASSFSSTTTADVSPILPDVPVFGGLNVSSTPLPSPKKSTDDQMQQQISSLLETIPARIRLTSEPESKVPSKLEIKKTRPSAAPYMRSSSSMSTYSRAPTPSFTLTPAYSKGPARQRAQAGNPEIKHYHLSRSTGEAPIKLLVRLVGENGERVMVRVGGGWADLGEYLKEYASHHGRRTAASEDSKVEIQDMTPRIVSSSSSTSTATIRGNGRSSPISRPGSAFDRPMSSLAIRKSRQSTGTSNELELPSFSNGYNQRSPSTPLPSTFSRASNMNNRQVETPPSVASSSTSTSASGGYDRDRSSSRLSWTEEDSSLGLAGPKSKRTTISERDQEWVESMKEKVRLASAEKERVNLEKDRLLREKEKSRVTSFGEMDRVGGTKRLFRKA